MGELLGKVLKVLVVVASAVIAYFIGFLWESMSSTPVSETELWGVRIIVFVCSLISLYFATKASGDR